MSFNLLIFTFCHGKNIEDYVVKFVSVFPLRLLGSVASLEKLSHPKLKKHLPRASLVMQWLRSRLPMQGTRVRALAREDPTCRGATKPVHHNY